MAHKRTIHGKNKKVRRMKKGRKYDVTSNFIDDELEENADLDKDTDDLEDSQLEANNFAEEIIDEFEEIGGQEKEIDVLEDSQLETMISAEEWEDEYDEFVEDMNEEPGDFVSVPYTSTFVKVIDLKGWLKSPWTSD